MLRRTWLLVALALVAFWTMAVSVSPRMGVTADEVVHLTGGYTYWKFNDYRLHPENGTLPMRIAALPLLGMNLAFPPLDHPEWLTSKVDRVGRIFFFELGNPFPDMLRNARMMIAVLGALTVWLTWRWARGLFGPGAGWIALTLAVFCPTLLAHSGLATSDIALTLCVLSALTVMWRLLHRVTWGRLALAALACGAAFLAKMSGVLIVPLIAALLLLRWLRPAPLVVQLTTAPRWLRRRSQVMLATTAVTLAVAAGSLVVLWGAYGFRYETFNREVSRETSFYLPWEVMLEQEPIPWSERGSLGRFTGPRPEPRPTGMTKLVGLLREHRLLPEAYLWGFAHTYKFSRERPAFLEGEYSRTGWASFFPRAFLWKTTLPALLLIAAGAAALVNMSWSAGRRRWIYRAAPLGVFFAVYGTMALNMNLNIGHRHILPMYPIFHVMASASFWWVSRQASRWIKPALVAALMLHAADSLAARPFYLSYFQPLAGGSSGGYRHLVDSSYDWGQGLPDFTAWLEQQRANGDLAPVYLTYFGADSTRARGIAVTRFGDEINDFGPRPFPAQIHGGWFAISATHFQRVYMPVRGAWTRAHETMYRTLMQRLQDSASHPPASELERDRLTQDAQDYELMQFGRISHYLHQREPLEVVGGSILIFHLEEAEVRFALYAPFEEFAAALKP